MECGSCKYLHAFTCNNEAKKEFRVGEQLMEEEMFKKEQCSFSATTKSHGHFDVKTSNIFDKYCIFFDIPKNLSPS